MLYYTNEVVNLGHVYEKKITHGLSPSRGGLRGSLVNSVDWFSVDRLIYVGAIPDPLVALTVGQSVQHSHVG